MANVSRISISHSDDSEEIRNISGLAENIYYDNSGQVFESNNLQDIVNELYEMIDTHDSSPDKMDKIDPTGKGAMSINRALHTDVGEYSAAIGKSNEASATGSFAEGSETKATGIASHSEGRDTTASGNYSHAEGSANIADGTASHAEGSNNTASGNQSHVGGEGSSADGDYAFVHGNAAKGEYKNDIVLGDHVQATHSNEVVVGTYNDLDPQYDADPSFVVGVGNDETTREDAFVVLKDGTIIALKDVLIKNEGDTVSVLGIDSRIGEQVSNIEEIKQAIGTEYSTLGDTVSEAIINVYKKTIVDNEVRAEEVTYDNTVSNLIAQQVQAAIDELVNRSPFKFGMNEYGEYGYYKDGADTVTPFRTSTSGVPLEKYFRDKIHTIPIGIKPLKVGKLKDRLYEPEFSGMNIDSYDKIHTIPVGIKPFKPKIIETLVIYEKIGTYTWTTEDKGSCTYNSDFVDADDCFKLKTEYDFNTYGVDYIDEGSLFFLPTKISKNNFKIMEDFKLNVSGCDSEFISDLTWEEMSTHTWNELQELTWQRKAGLLIKAENIYYTIKDGELVQLDITSLTAQTFKDYGFFINEMDNISIIQDLELPVIYFWDSNPEEEHHLSLTMHGIPVPQVVISESIILQQESIVGISSIVAEEYSGNPEFAFNPYGLTTWRVFLPEIGWGTLKDGELTGDTAEVINNMSAIEWNSTKTFIYGEGLPRSVYQSFKIRFVLKSEEDSITKITVTYLNQED